MRQKVNQRTAISQTVAAYHQNQRQRCANGGHHGHPRVVGQRVDIHMRNKSFFIGAIAALGLVMGSAASANTTEYSHDFSDGVGDWAGDITHSASEETADVSGSAYSYFDGVADPAVWPENGYLTELKVYLDPGAMTVGDGFDLTVASARQDGTHLRDFIFHVGKTGDGQVLVNGSNNTDFTVNEYKLLNDGDGTPTTITEAGWYTFQHVFRDAGDGSLAVDLQVFDSAGTQIFTTTRNNPADLLDTIVGGVAYQWFTFTSGTFEIDDQLLEFVTPAGPADKNDCKDGGFEAFGFANQGQCVASVQANAHAGK